MNKKKNDVVIESKKVEQISDKKAKKNAKKGAVGPIGEDKMKAKLTKEEMYKQAAEIHTGEVNALCDDIDRCLSVLASAIPPRLSVPLLLQGAPNLFKMGHGVAQKFSFLLGEVWGNLDRSTVVQHIIPLSSLATISLDYRRAYGDQSEAATEVDYSVSDAVVQLCLKLTESELKSLLSKMAEWRDIDVESDKNGNNKNENDDKLWKKYSRGVSYYSLVSLLASRLRSIFLPSMALIWTNAVNSLENMIIETEKYASLNNSSIENSGKKLKKRKNIEGDEGNNAGRNVLSELVFRSEFILESVKTSCVYDTDGFIDEDRYVYICIYI
jgi:hypothetical protein